MLFTMLLSAKSHGLDMGELPVNFTNMLFVSVGEGKIVGTDVRRQKSRLTSPVCTAVTRSLQPAG